MEQKTGRKLLFFLLTLAMVIGLLPGISLTVQAASAEVSCGDGVTWSYDSETTTLSISGTGVMKNYDLAISVPWNNYKSEITKISISDGVTSIGQYAFHNCEKITEVIIPSSVTSIGEEAFSACSSLAAVTIPSNVTNIGHAAFTSCSALTAVTIPSSVTSIGNSAFHNCSKLGKITFVRPTTSSNLSVGQYAFTTDESGSSNIPIQYTGSGNLILFYGDTQITAGKTSGDLNGKDLTWEEAGEKYPLWVGDTRVTESANSGEGWSYDAASNTLTLSGVTITTGYQDVGPEYGIYYAGSGSLAIALATGSVNTVGSQTQLNEGILAPQGGITISGEGELSAYGNSVGIEVKQNLTIKSGTVRAAGTLGGGIGLFSDGDVTIEGGTVIAVSDVHDNGICANGNVIIKGGGVTASGQLGGIYTSESGNLVKNAIAGTGWTDVAGTEGETAIAASTAGQQLNRYKKVQFLTSHTHSFAYTASGATITATCGAADCPLAGHKATLTINEPTGLTYDGTAKAAAVTGEIPGVTTPTITYTKTGDTAFTGTPTGAGTYTASITLGGATASVEYTIAQKEVTVSGITASDKIYDGNTDAALETTAVAITGKLTDDTLTVTGTGTFDNANVGENKTVTISDLTLGGASKDNYKLAATGQQTTATAKITAKEVGLNWSNTELAFTGEAQKPTAEATGVVDGDTCTVTVSGEQTNIGDNYTASAESLSNSNYKLPENKTTTFKIVKANAVASTVSANNRTYDGTEKPLVTVDNSTLVGGEMWYALGENATTAPAESLYTTSIPAKTDAGTYYVWYMVAGDANHVNSTPECIIVIINESTGTYTTVSVTGAFHVIGDGTDAVIIVKRSENDALTYKNFESVSVGGKAVAESNYAKKEGSLILTLKAAYLDTLAEGDHKVDIIFSDGSAETTLRIAAMPDDIPKTGDNFSLAACLLMLVLGILGICGVKMSSMKE